MSATCFLSGAEEHQTTDTILMVSPDHFRFNAETAKSNAFQNEMNASKENVTREFDSMVNTLRKEGVRVLVLPSRKDVQTPDAVFPNNWFSVHATQKRDEKKLVLYPMLAENRRLEIQTDNLIEALKGEGMNVAETIDLSTYVSKSMFLEGTGSLILDRVNRIAYVALSPRSTPDMVELFARRMGYKAHTFRSYDRNRQLIYHTNVMMSVGSSFAVVSLESVTNETEREALSLQLHTTNKEVVPITLQQVASMAGNILEVKSTDGKAKVVMSRSAYDAFTSRQRETLSKHAELVPVDVKTIETNGEPLAFWSTTRFWKRSFMRKSIETSKRSKTNALDLSIRYEDKPMSPLETAFYWTEYVIRHSGAPHLRTSAAVHMLWYEYLLLDVIVSVVFVAVIAFVSVYWAVRSVCRLRRPNLKVKTN